MPLLLVVDGFLYDGAMDLFMLNTAKNSKRPFRIAILAYQACMGTEIFAIADALLIATHIARAMGNVVATLFDVQVIGLLGKNVTVAGGITVGTKRPRGVYDLLIVPGLEVSQRGQWAARLAPLQHELAFIQKTFARGTPVASVCCGSFLLAEAGLLNGRKATTAWLFAKELASGYPTVQVTQDAVLIEDGAVTTTGAVSSAFDLAIHIIKRQLGAQVATATARVALLQNSRSSQLPYVDEALVEPGAAPLGGGFSVNVKQWLKHRQAAPYDLEALAQAFYVSSRTLLRRVKAETGQSPLTLLQHARVDTAKKLLSTTTRSIARITEDIGYSDVATFSRLFAKYVGETPAKYRHRHSTPARKHITDKTSNHRSQSIE
jgi:transcriptional regulator GlxA family with amidase domain